jgi:hypothetical protein
MQQTKAVDIKAGDVVWLNDRAAVKVDRVVNQTAKTVKFSGTYTVWAFDGSDRIGQVWPFTFRAGTVFDVETGGK